MVGLSEKLIHREPRPAGDRKRNLVLKASTSLLLLTLCLAIVFRSEFKRPWFIVGALLPPVAQTVLALAYYDKIRSSFLVVRQSLTLELLSICLSFPTMVLTLFAEASYEVSFMICCVYIVWGGMFEVGLGLASRFHYAHIYTGMTLGFVKANVKYNCLVCAWPCLIPVFLGSGMILWRNLSVKAVEEWSGA